MQAKETLPMIDVFKVPVHIGMSTNASPVLSAMLRQLTGIHTVRASHRLASVEVADIERLGHAQGADRWVAHDPDDPAPVAKPNPAHALIKGLPPNAAGLREQLALHARVTGF